MSSRPRRLHRTARRVRPRPSSSACNSASLCQKPCGAVFRFVGLLVLFLTACSEPEQTQQPEALRIGVPNQATSALVHLALERGYFAKRGLQVDPVFFDSGKLALAEGLLAGRVDYALSAEIPFLWQLRHEDDLRVLASVYSSDNANRIVGRRDRGIATLSDLRGKVIGTQKDSAVHYFLYCVLRAQGYTEADVTTSFLAARDLPSALAEGRIDAFSAREPYVSEALDRLGDAAVVFSLPGAYLQSELLVGRLSELAGKPQVARRLLQALIDAEDDGRKHADEMVDIVARHLGADPRRIARVLDDGFNAVLLDQSLLPLMEAELQWMAGSVPGNGDEVTDILRYIATEPLQAVNPQRVLIVQ
ncbi:MAG: ABC transporter substrate-binding protein [Chromatiales bacterium]|nr:ABC transporter substrate-binding protein [Chromatiales bacterium]